MIKFCGVLRVGRNIAAGINPPIMIIIKPAIEPLNVARALTRVIQLFPSCSKTVLLPRFMALKIGDQVSLKGPLPYLKTSDAMPMLRPPDLVSTDELGEVIGLRAMDVVEVRFRRGCFLITSDRLVVKESD